MYQRVIRQLRCMSGRVEAAEEQERGRNGLKGREEGVFDQNYICIGELFFHV